MVPLLLLLPAVRRRSRGAGLLGGKSVVEFVLFSQEKWCDGLENFEMPVSTLLSAAESRAAVMIEKGDLECFSSLAAQVRMRAI